MNAAGFAIAALFVLTWAVAVGIWHYGRIETRWSGHGARALPARRADPAETAAARQAVTSATANPS